MISHTKESKDENEMEPIKFEILLKKRFKFQYTLKATEQKVGLFIALDLAYSVQFGGKHKNISKQMEVFFNLERDVLMRLRNNEGFPKLIESGYDDENDVFYIAMNKLDEDLHQIVKRSVQKKLQLQTVVNIGLVLIDRLEVLHEHGYLHRDMKPKNIMLNYSKQEITLIDFGLCNKYLTQYENHIPFKSTKKILGTPLYASNNALLGKEISRRDDVESFIYILIFLLIGSLPWKGQLTLDFLQLPAAKSKIIEWRNPDGDLCKNIEGNFLQIKISIAEFKEMLIYAQNIDFDEEPDYEYLENLLLQIKEKHKLGDSFEWESPNFGQEQNYLKRKRRSKVRRKSVNASKHIENRKSLLAQRSNSPNKDGEQTLQQLQQIPLKKLNTIKIKKARRKKTFGVNKDLGTLLDDNQQNANGNIQELKNRKEQFKYGWKSFVIKNQDLYFQEEIEKSKENDDEIAPIQDQDKKELLVKFETNNSTILMNQQDFDENIGCNNQNIFVPDFCSKCSINMRRIQMKSTP